MNLAPRSFLRIYKNEIFGGNHLPLSAWNIRSFTGVLSFAAYWGGVFPPREIPTVARAFILGFCYLASAGDRSLIRGLECLGSTFSGTCIFLRTHDARLPMYHRIWMDGVGGEEGGASDGVWRRLLPVFQSLGIRPFLVFRFLFSLFNHVQEVEEDIDLMVLIQ